MTSLPPRFWANVVRPARGTRRCWYWIGSGAPSYGTFGMFGARLVAHRLSYIDTFGPIPEGLEIDHLCRVHCCVNPYHLEPVTRSENTLRGYAARATPSLAAADRRKSDRINRLIAELRAAA